METIRLEVCIYENEYGMCVSLVLLHGVFVLCTWGMLSLHMVVCS